MGRSMVRAVFFNLFAAPEPSANVCVVHATLSNDPSVHIATKSYNCCCEFRSRQFRSVSAKPLAAMHGTPRFRGTRAGESELEESEVFRWSRSRITINTGSRSWSRIFCPTPTRDVSLDHILSHSLKLGIPVEMVQFLLELLLKQRFLAVHHDFP